MDFFDFIVLFVDTVALVLGLLRKLNRLQKDLPGKCRRSTLDSDRVKKVGVMAREESRSLEFRTFFGLRFSHATFCNILRMVAFRVKLALTASPSWLARKLSSHLAPAKLAS